MSPSAVVDFTNAGQTIPARKVASDPSTCTVGEQYFNTTSNVLKVCTATNTWTTSSAPPGASGGVPYYSSASALASSSMLNANSVVVGGGAGAAPKASGVTIDASNNLSTPGTLSTGSGGSSHGKLALGELPANGAQTVGWEAPDSITSSLSLMFPNANPTANSFLGFPAPTAGVAQGSWFTFGTGLVAGNPVTIDTSYLNTLYPQLFLGPNLYSAGVKNVFTPSATTAGERTVCGSNPSALVAGDRGCDVSGFAWTYDGTNINYSPHVAGNGITSPPPPTSGNVAIWGANFSQTGLANSSVPAAGQLRISTTPALTATQSIFGLGSAPALCPTAANSGCYHAINTAAGFVGDFFHYEVNGANAIRANAVGANWYLRFWAGYREWCIN